MKNSTIFSIRLAPWVVSKESWYGTRERLRFPVMPGFSHYHIPYFNGKNKNPGTCVLGKVSGLKMLKQSPALWNILEKEWSCLVYRNWIYFILFHLFIYFFAFGRCFCLKRLTLHSMYARYKKSTYYGNKRIYLSINWFFFSDT